MDVAFEIVLATLAFTGALVAAVAASRPEGPSRARWRRTGVALALIVLIVSVWRSVQRSVDAADRARAEARAADEARAVLRPTIRALLLPFLQLHFQTRDGAPTRTEYTTPGSWRLALEDLEAPGRASRLRTVDGRLGGRTPDRVFERLDRALADARQSLRADIAATGARLQLPVVVDLYRLVGSPFAEKFRARAGNFRSFEAEATRSDGIAARQAERAREEEAAGHPSAAGAAREAAEDARRRAAQFRDASKFSILPAGDDARADEALTEFREFVGALARIEAEVGVEFPSRHD
ncbi:MAG: hypothetical protein IT460_08950 [Planctomycetes bacterium]|nr:hypothetical protein [Planctomycetota bacterium]